MSLHPTAAKYVADRIKMPRIIWFAMMGTVLMLTALAWHNGQAVPEAERPASNPQTIYLFGGLALAMAVVSRVVPGMLFDAAVQRARTQPVTREGLAAMKDNNGRRLFSDAAIDQVFEMPEHERVVVPLLSSYTTSRIIQWVTSEAVAVFGFVAATISVNPQLMWPFAAVALVLLLISPPKAETVLEKLGGGALGQMTAKTGV
jgi:hypothetical protein